MQVTQISEDGLRQEFKVVISAQDIEDKVEHRLFELGQSVRVPGFRPGKVPAAVLKSRFGTAVTHEVVEKAVSESADQAMAERGMRPAVQPRIEVTSYEEGGDLEYTMAVEVMPQVEPVDFANFELERLVVKVDPKEVESTLQQMADQHKKSEPIAEARPAQKGDVMVFDFVGRVGGKEFPGGAAKDHHLELGSNSFVEGFEDQLVGLSPGERATVNITFPTEYVNDELAGKGAAFEVEVKEIRVPVAVPIDDELAKLTGYDSLEAMRTSVGERIESEYAGISRSRIKRSLLDTLASAHDFPVPPSMVEIEFEAIWKQVEERLEEDRKAGEGVNKSAEELRQEYRDIAERRVRLGLLISDVGERNNIVVEPEEVNRAVIAEARRFPGQENLVIGHYQKNPEELANVRAPIFEEKVVDFILEMAKVTEREVNLQDLLRDPEQAEAAPDASAEKDTKSSKAKSKSTGKSKGAAKSKPKTAPEAAAGSGDDSAEQS